ncbi:MFS transporter, AAHS family, benzoate transport protein [Variovorax sp. YR752]|uniref:MFS transporter n=1 Tax=unclassified Variovorax TaxID=663243 RepID=UPI0002714697|nr:MULTISPECIES: MFS transporter [unclassified Variovorax]EJL67553.1 arabinose efflux permease family protein [Variovorax sp. CF313]SOD30627.1 MFS transporter, AAHS family, benzoate transport protein [Variovorax sp. YR752]
MQSIDLHKLVDEARFNRFHAVVLILCAVIIVADGYDLAVAGIALPAIMSDMNVNPTTAGFMASSALFGMMFGAVGMGMLADIIGRRWALSISVLLFSVFTAAAGLAHDPIAFSVLRFIAGLGIGGALPCSTAHVTEFAPKKLRGLLATAMLCGYAVGSVLATLVGKQFLEKYGWQSVFFAAGAPIVLIPFILKYMPESLPFLIKRNDNSRIRAIVARLAPSHPLDAGARFLAPIDNKAEGVPIGRLFRDGRGFSTVMFAAAFFSVLFMMYALSTWLVKLMAMAGHSVGSALNFLLLYNGGAIVGAVFGGWLSDKLKIKWVLCIFFAVSVVSLTLLGHGVQPLSLIVAVVGASTLGTGIVLHAYAAQFYPAPIRSTGVGFASSVGRAGGISAPIGIGVLMSMKLPLEQNFISIAMAGLVGAIAVALIDHRRSASAHAIDASKGLDAREAEAVTGRAAAASP